MNWRTCLLFAALICGGKATAWAQGSVDFRGRVVDAVTGAGLSDAIVRIPAIRRYTLTDAGGNFVISRVPAGIQTVVIMQLGYGEVTQHIEVQPDSAHVFRITPQPIRLEGLIAADTRRIQHLMNNAAQTRATDMGPAGRPPVFWNAWDRDAIVRSGIDDPLLFLRKGPPRLAIRNCSGLDQPANRLCVSVPFDGMDPPGFGGNPAVWTPRVTNTERLRLGGRIRITPPSTRIAAVLLDDRPIGALENLARYSMNDFYRVETYGYRGERAIRLYTEGYLRLVAAGLIQPDIRREPEIFEIRGARSDTLQLTRRCCQ